MKKVFIALSAACLLMSACSSNDDENIQVVNPPQLTKVQSRVAEDVSSFDISFFKEAAKQDGSNNTLVSPVSMSMLLSALANGCDQEMADQIVTVLGCNDIDALNELARNYSEWLPVADKGVTVSVANSFWYDKQFTLNQAFRDLISEKYAAECFAGNFDNHAALKEAVDKWASSRTNGRINNIPVDAIAMAGSRTIQMNALYFYGSWEKKFDPAKTKDYVFKGASNSNVKMMCDNDTYLYMHTENASAVRLPFSKGMFYADFILPNEGTDINSYIASDDLETIQKGVFSKAVISLSLPRFSLNAKDVPFINYTGILQDLGITSLGEIRSFKYFNEDYQIPMDVFQGATVSFDETGAEAAAVSYAGLVGAPLPIAMTFDRPFVFFIHEAMTNRILFAGKVTDL